MVLRQKKHHGVAPEEALGGIDVGEGGPLEVGQQRPGHAVGTADLLEAPAQSLDEVHLPVAQAQRLDVANEAGDGGTTGVGRAAKPGLPAAVELLDLTVVHLLVGEHDEIGLGRVAQEVAIEAQAVPAHVHGHPRRGDGGQPGILLQGVEVPEPDHLVGSEGDHPVPPVVHESPDVLVPVGDYGDAVGAQRPQLAVAVGVAVEHPEGGPPEVQVDLGGAPEVGAGVPAVDPLQKPLGRVFRADGEARWAPDSDPVRR